MKTVTCFLAVCVCLVLTPQTAFAEDCGMYVYRETWPDGDGNAVALNFTDGVASCGEYTAYSEVNVSLPGPYTYFDSSYEACCAESIAYGPIASGDEGTVDEFNEVYYSSCGSYISSGLLVTIAIKITVGQNTIYDDSGPGTTRYCYYAPSCTNTSTPACPNFGSWLRVGVKGVACESFIRSNWLAVRFAGGSYYVCFVGVSTATPGPGYCDPE